MSERLNPVAIIFAGVILCGLCWISGKHSADRWFATHATKLPDCPEGHVCALEGETFTIYPNRVVPPAPADIDKPQAQQPDMVQTAPVQVTLKQFQYCIDLALVMHGTCDYTVLAHPVIVFKKYRYEICGPGVKSDCAGEQPVATAHPLKPDCVLAEDFVGGEATKLSPVPCVPTPQVPQ